MVREYGISDTSGNRVWKFIKLSTKVHIIRTVDRYVPMCVYIHIYVCVCRYTNTYDPILLFGGYRNCTVFVPLRVYYTAVYDCASNVLGDHDHYTSTRGPPYQHRSSLQTHHICTWLMYVISIINMTILECNFKKPDRMDNEFGNY